MFKGLRNKFLFMHMGIVTLIVFVFFGTILVFNYQNMHRNSDEMLNRTAGDNMHSMNMRPPKDGFRSKFSPVFTVELNANNDIANIISTFDVEDGFYDEVTKMALAKNKESASIHYDESVFKYLISNNQIIFLDISKEMQMFTNTIYTFLWIALPLLIVLFFLSLYFANRSIKPIEETYYKQKEFIADASHELKTPLAVISTNVDMLLGNSDGEQQKWLCYVKKETERMANLISSLLFLTKLDYVQEKTIMNTIDFSKLIEDYLMPLEALFYENKTKTQIDILPNIKINGDMEQIRRLVAILIDNAIKYTDGNIRIDLVKGENNAKLTVYNTGKGIPLLELPNIWERFYRGDKSRENTGGFGLGLPIAKSITEKHKGSIIVESRENEWTRFILKLPLEK